MKDNTDPRRTHSAVCVTVQMSPAAQACSAAETWDRPRPLAPLGLAWKQSHRFVEEQDRSNVIEV
jgi:hypothetical protein